MGWFTIGTLVCRPGSTVTAVARYADHIDLFTTASDGRVMSTWWDVRSGWANWFQVVGGVAAQGATVTAVARYPFHSTVHRRHRQPRLQRLVGRAHRLAGLVPPG